MNGIIVVSLSVVLCSIGAKALDLQDELRYDDCDDVLGSSRYKESGSYILYLNSLTPLEVNCNFEALNSPKAGIMMRKYGNISFARNFSEYENGFGHVNNGDYWLGLRWMKSLIDTGYRILTITLQDWSDRFKVLQYNYFFLGSASTGYRLTIGKYQSSHVLPDDFSHNNGMRFATIDRPDDHMCAVNQKGGWWYNYCSYTLPTGHYYHGGPYKPSGSFYDGMFYKDWHGYDYSLKSIKMELSKN